LSRPLTLRRIVRCDRDVALVEEAMEVGTEEKPVRDLIAGQLRHRVECATPPMQVENARR